MSVPDKDRIYGLAARYETKGKLLEAVHLAKREGYQRMEAYSPFPLEEIDESLGNTEKVLPWVVFAGAVTGGLTGFFMQYTANVFFLQLDIGGRPYNSWPAFIPITFELTILFAALAGFFGVLIKCGFPQIYHPVFNISSFERASVDSFFLCITADDPKFHEAEVNGFLKQTGPKEINSIEA